MKGVNHLMHACQHHLCGLAVKASTQCFAGQRPSYTNDMKVVF